MEVLNLNEDLLNSNTVQVPMVAALRGHTVKTQLQAKATITALIIDKMEATEMAETEMEGTAVEIVTAAANITHLLEEIRDTPLHNNLAEAATTECAIKAVMVVVTAAKVETDPASRKVTTTTLLIQITGEELRKIR